MLVPTLGAEGLISYPNETIAVRRTAHVAWRCGRGTSTEYPRSAHSPSGGRMAEKKKPAKETKKAPTKKAGKSKELSMEDLKKVSGGLARAKKMK